MFRRLLIPFIPVSLLVAACGKFPLSADDSANSSCDFQGTIYHLSGSGRVDATTSSAIRAEGLSDIGACGPFARPFYTALFRLDSREGSYRVTVGAKARFWIVSSTQTMSDDGEATCEPGVCSEVGEVPSDCSPASASGGAGGALGLGGQSFGGQGLGGEGSGEQSPAQGGDCSFEPNESRYEMAIKVSASAHAANFIRVVSNDPIPVSFEVDLLD